jgi:hypothetical protein
MKHLLNKNTGENNALDDRLASATSVASARPLAVMLENHTVKMTNGTENYKLGYSDTNHFDEYLFRSIELYGNKRCRWTNGIWTTNVTNSVVDKFSAHNSWTDI